MLVTVAWHSYFCRFIICFYMSIIPFLFQPCAYIWLFVILFANDSLANCCAPGSRVWRHAPLKQRAHVKVRWRHTVSLFACNHRQHIETPLPLLVIHKLYVTVAILPVWRLTLADHARCSVCGGYIERVLMCDVIADWLYTLMFIDVFITCSRTVIVSNFA